MVVGAAGKHGQEQLHVNCGERTARELPAWMFDAEICASMSLGEPQVALGVLHELAGLLDEMLRPASSSSVPSGTGPSDGDTDSEFPASMRRSSSAT